jgi:hypothetical protein
MMTRAGFSGPPLLELFSPISMKSILVLLAAVILAGSLAPLHADGGKSGDERADRRKKTD